MKYKNLIIKSVLFVSLLSSLRLGISIFLSKTNIFIKYLEIPSDFYFATQDIMDPLFKAGLFVLFIFFIINHKKLSIFNSKFDKKTFFRLGIISLIVLILHYTLKLFINRNLDLTLQAPLFWGILKFVLNVVFTLLLFISCFGIKWVKKILEQFKHQIKYYIVGFIGVFGTIFYFQKLWPFFSGSVASILAKILTVFFPNTIMIPALMKGQGPIISTANFTVQIGSPCSGIDSLLMFTALYIVIFALDKSKLKLKQYWALFPVGLAGMYLFNVLRLFLLMLVGIYISPELAEGIFHQNIGWILFIIYFYLWNKITDKIVYKGKK